MLYEAICPKCKKAHVYKSPVSERNIKAPQCCGMQTVRRILTPPMGVVIGPAAG